MQRLPELKTERLGTHGRKNTRSNGSLARQPVAGTMFPTLFPTLSLTLALLGGSLAGCAIGPETEQGPMVLLTGRVVAVLTGDRARKFEPALRSIELGDQRNGTRHRIAVGGDDTSFAVLLPLGQYDVNRVQISEGPFLSVAVPAVSIVLNEGPIVFSGTWRFGVDSPKYGRMVRFSALADEAALTLTRQKVETDYPALASSPVVTALPVPTQAQARLFEVAPYPRIPQYFRRHYW